ncbi:MAG: glycosyltransferase family 4 protein [Bacteroidetes bacterium]|nr:glycosyltransferase family 4 protein [Bacteroidota bacterium]
MKILHCCLAAFYIDNFGYQENILPKMHKLQGHEVKILASTETYIENSLDYIQPCSYINNDQIEVIRIPYANWLPLKIVKKLRIYNGISDTLESFNPDIIFLHDCQFIGIKEIAAYAKKHTNTRIYVDGHTDFINSAKTWISKNILHKIIYKWCVKKISPYTKKFYGTLPLRVEFFKNIYHTPPEKTELLQLGIDDTQVDFSQKEVIRKVIRKELKLSDNDFVIITGGKIDRRKNIHHLIKVVNEIKNVNIKLIVFGTPTPDMKDEIRNLLDSPAIRYLGWVPSEKVYNYFFAGDLAFFPGTHSVLWEQAVGIGLPCIFKKWEGIQHIDIGGNCLFINSNDEIKDNILALYQNKSQLALMKQIAMEKGVNQFSYYEIAKKAIEE